VAEELKAKINESCIIGLPTCGYAFNSSRMAFIAAPSDDEFSLELDVLQSLLKEKDYEAHIALRQSDPAKLTFCTKICSKIITSQFCIVLLNPSSYASDSAIKIPNPNVHLEYGMMLPFKKYIIPFQKDGSELAFNIRPLDTIIYNPGNFREKANAAIDEAILKVGTTARPVRALISNETIMRYILVRRLKIADIGRQDANALYQLGKTLGYYLLDGNDEIVYFGLFDREVAKEVVFRLKLLIQNIHDARRKIEEEKASYDEIQQKTVDRILGLLKIEVLISKELSKDRIRARVQELTREMWQVPWELLTEEDVELRVRQEYSEIGEL